MREAGEVVIHGRGVPTREYLEAPKRDYDQYDFQLAITNIGEVTLDDLVLVLDFASDFRLSQLRSQVQEEVVSGRPQRYRFAKGTTTTTLPGRGDYSPPEQKLFPGDRISFPDCTWSILVPAGASMPKRLARLHWAIYLDDAPPSTGEIDITE
jgi:hypothetical protein